MAQKKIEVFLKLSAERQITAIAVYIEESGYPETAEKFAAQLYEFAQILSTLPLKYALCRNETLAKKNFRCAVFKKNYIFVYNLFRTRMTVYQVIHTSRIR